MNNNLNEEAHGPADSALDERGVVRERGRQPALGFRVEGLMCGAEG